MKLSKQALRKPIALVSIALVITGCGGLDDSSNPPAPASISVVTGDQQTALTMQALPLPVTVVVKDAGGIPVSSALVTFLARDGGAASPDMVSTSATGEASAYWTLGPTTGRQTLRVLVAEVARAEVEATATSPFPRVAKFSGDLQTVPQFGFLSEPLQVVVTDALGRPADVQVMFKTSNESGFATNENVRTDPDTGRAAALAGGWLYFNRVGTALVEATAEGFGAASFTVNVGAASAAHPYDGIYKGSITFKIINGVILGYFEPYTYGTLDEADGSITVEHGVAFMAYTYKGKIVLDDAQQATASGLSNKRGYIPGSGGPWDAKRQ